MPSIRIPMNAWMHRFPLRLTLEEALVLAKEATEDQPVNLIFTSLYAILVYGKSQQWAYIRIAGLRTTVQHMKKEIQ